MIDSLGHQRKFVTKSTCCESVLFTLTVVSTRPLWQSGFLTWIAELMAYKSKAGSKLLTSKSLILFISPSASPPTQTCIPSKEEPFSVLPLETHSATLLSGFVLLTTSVSSSPQQKLTPIGLRPNKFMELAGEDIASSRQSRRRLSMLKKKQNSAGPEKSDLSW